MSDQKSHLGKMLFVIFLGVPAVVLLAWALDVAGLLPPE